MLCLEHMSGLEALFTWVTRRSNLGYMAARLDRVLVSDDFLDLWQTTSATILPRVSSDHHPILLWLHATADHVSLTVTASNPIQRVTQKLKRLKVTLKAWNRDTFRNVYVVMEDAAEALNAIQAETALLGDTGDVFMAEVKCNICLNKGLAQHQALSTQHNHLQWLHDGDRNSKFFHTMNRVCKTSTILSLFLIDDVLSFDTESISNKVVDFFTELFTNQDQGMYDDSVLGNFILPLLDHILKAPRYLLYADNILIFAKATPSNIRQLHHILSAYGGLSGQLYNPSMSKVYFGSAVSHSVKNAILRTMGISEGALPFSYLGVPIFRGAPRTWHLAAMADSIITKFSKWKGHSLSLAGRKCMVNSIITASLVHSTMVYYWPRSLLKKIKTAMRNFLWTSDISKKNTSCSVSWARCCSPIDEGGLGICSLRLANDSFVCKLAGHLL
ncbi:hypothetical protein ACS0TY_006543 [Phlomoides rotata]